ncbi:uncharacterized protein G2W53_005373 [Senna tora]|uniref:Uncharacterized protein n=1 Tax=Senna tora TaxID=362788 RepID=A0A835CK62_9FABA|nr:uncharacterized protein G2W53_005373 [Senna tora]
MVVEVGVGRFAVVAEKKRVHGGGRRKDTMVNMEGKREGKKMMVAESEKEGDGGAEEEEKGLRV